MELRFPQKKILTDEIKDNKRPNSEEKGHYLLVIKHLFKLYHYKDGVQVAEYYVATGLNSGDKQAVGDMRTPIGRFPIVGIEDSSKWEHDFGDGKGSIKGAYGPWFIRLLTNSETTISKQNWRGIGIHGTHLPESIGTEATEGCIRLKNHDVVKLVQSLPEDGANTIVEIIE